MRSASSDTASIVTTRASPEFESSPRSGRIPDEIAGLSAAQVSQVLSQLKHAGIKALVSRSNPGFVNDEGWIGIPRTDIYVRKL